MFVPVNKYNLETRIVVARSRI